MRTRLLADATLIRYGAWTYSGMLDAFSTSASLAWFGLLPALRVAEEELHHIGAVGLGRGHGIVLVDVRTNKHAASLMSRPDSSCVAYPPRSRGECARSRADRRVVGVPSANVLADPPDASQMAGRIAVSGRHRHCGAEGRPRSTKATTSNRPPRSRRFIGERLRRSSRIGLCHANPPMRVPYPTLASRKSPWDTGGFSVVTSDSPSSRSRPAEPRHRWPGRSQL